MKMPRRIHMRPIVRGQSKALHRPAFAIWKVLFGKPREKHRDLLPRVFMGHIGDLRPHHGRIGHHVVGNRD